MEILAQIILALIPSTAVIIIVYLMLKKNNEKEFTQLSSQLKRERQQFFLEPRVDAYQRITLFLERINPHNLIMRLHKPNQTAVAFQQELLQQIRNEYDHNVAQQIFISPQAWEMVKKSKEETVNMINIAARQLEKETTSTELSGKIFEVIAEVGELPTDITIQQLKKELQRLF